MESRNIAAATGFGTTKRLLAEMLHLSATEARTRVSHAAQIARRTLGGEVLPNTAAALAAGEIGPAQVRVIAEAGYVRYAQLRDTRRRAGLWVVPDPEFPTTPPGESKGSRGGRRVDPGAGGGRAR